MENVTPAHLGRPNQAHLRSPLGFDSRLASLAPSVTLLPPRFLFFSPASCSLLLRHTLSCRYRRRRALSHPRLLRPAGRGDPAAPRPDTGAAAHLGASTAARQPAAACRLPASRWTCPRSCLVVLDRTSFSLTLCHDSILY